MAGENRDAVLLPQYPDRGLEMQFHAEAVRHDGGLIRPALVDLADPDLLQRHDIGLTRRDHVADPLGIDLAIGSEPAVDVVGQDPKDPAMLFGVHH